MKDAHLYEETLKQFVGVAPASIKANLKKVQHWLKVLIIVNLLGDYGMLDTRSKV